MLSRVFPKTIDNTYRGLWPGLVLFGLLLFVKAAMGTNSIINTANIASGADGIPLDQYGVGGAQAVLALFALIGFATLILVLLCVIALVRYRAMIPLMFLVLLIEHAGRRALIMANPIERADGGAPIAFYINLGLTIALVLGFLFSIIGKKYAAPAAGSAA